MARKLFCEICPLFYSLSVWKNRMRRYLSDMVSSEHFVTKRDTQPLPALIMQHQSMIRRKLGNVDPVLQGNKAVNLSLAAPRINGILIRPGETFSFWRLVGMTSARRGYKAGLVIRTGKANQDIGGGMCQMSNLIHWLVLHSPLDIVEHHHHDKWDLFPDFGRQVPFGTGTSVSHNYIDYRFRNNTEQCFQLLVWCDDEYLHGELRAEHELAEAYRIECEDEYFCREEGVWYRNNRIYRHVANKATGQPAREPELLKANHAQVMYDIALADQEKVRR